MGLFNLFSKKQAPLDRLTPEGDFPWGWHAANRVFTQNLENQYEVFTTAVYNAKKHGARAEYAALKSLVKFREDVQRLCAQKGECFMLWASITISNPVSMKNDADRLHYLEGNMEALLSRECAVQGLKQGLLSIISSEPGVVQSDIYKRYDPSFKGAISNELYQMETLGIIIREKSGRSYKLYMK